MPRGLVGPCNPIENSAVTGHGEEVEIAGLGADRRRLAIVHRRVANGWRGKRKNLIGRDMHSGQSFLPRLTREAIGCAIEALHMVLSIRNDHLSSIEKAGEGCLVQTKEMSSCFHVSRLIRGTVRNGRGAGCLHCDHAGAQDIGSRAPHAPLGMQPGVPASYHSHAMAMYIGP